MDGVASHPPCALQLHYLPSKVLPDSISGQNFLGGMPPDPQQEHAKQDAECGLHTI